MPNLYSATEIIGKTLVANTAVSIKRIASDSAPIVFTVSPKASVGVVYSYLSPGADRKNLYWQFIDSSGRPYYAEHVVGRFNIGALQSQGSKDEDQVKAEQAAANQNFGDKALLTLVKIGGLFVVGWIFKSVIDKKL